MADSPRDPPNASVHVPEGEWVEIERVVLRAPARARNVPPDTALTDFVARVRGFLVAGADLGSNATVRTLLDREVGGRLVEFNGTDWVSRMLNPRPLRSGERVAMSLDLSQAHLFAIDTGKTLRS